ncbi:LCP family protein [Actinoallomurus sp. NPDC050550]|uniref:LCP family glycopolymer transferase n=1 Tax=Actinoallomurus sp. NPDC050550 TaxID=3154937 RepID=UPI0033F68927
MGQRAVDAVSDGGEDTATGDTEGDATAEDAEGDATGRDQEDGSTAGGSGGGVAAERDEADATAGAVPVETGAAAKREPVVADGRRGALAGDGISVVMAAAAKKRLPAAVNTGNGARVATPADESPDAVAGDGAGAPDATEEKAAPAAGGGKPGASAAASGEAAGEGAVADGGDAPALDDNVVADGGGAPVADDDAVTDGRDALAADGGPDAAVPDDGGAPAVGGEAASGEDGSDAAVAEPGSEAVADDGAEAALQDAGPADGDAAVGGRSRRGLGSALGLTVASAVVWGVAHIWAGRRVAGFLLMGLFAIIVGGGVAVGLLYQHDLKQIAVQRDWLAGITGGILALALVWAVIVVRSYQVVRPRGMARTARVLAGALVVVLAVGVCSPLVWAARSTYTLRDTIGTIFHGDEARPQPPVNMDDPWKDKPRVNILLLGGDGAGDRVGVRTDSMTVASVDTKTGNTVLFSLPRNLQHFPMIPRLRSRWPDGFTGVGAPGDEGLLNELFQDAEDDPSLVPGFDKGRRGPELVREEISYLIGQPIDYYILVNLFGFADIVDAIGGVKVHIAQDIPFGGPEDGSAPTGVLKAGDRELSGKEALWFGRSRTASSDFVRMGRQKCLMKAIAEQADPQRVLTRFQQLAAAAKKTISANIPAELLPALIKLSSTVKHGAQIGSLMFVPPEFHVVRPDVGVMRRAVTNAIAASEAGSATASPNPEASASAQPSGVSAAPGASSGPSSAPTAEASPAGSGSAASPAGSPGDSATPSAGDQPSAGASPSARAKDKAVSLTAACGG